MLEEETQGEEIIWGLVGKVISDLKIVVALVSWQWRQAIWGVVFGRELEISEGTEIQKWDQYWWDRFKSILCWCDNC